MPTLPSRSLWLLGALAGGCAPDISFQPLEVPPAIPSDPPDIGPRVDEESLGQRVPPQIDVLWVIDDSASMLDRQNALARNADVFIREYVESGLDWHIGVVTTNFRGVDFQGKLQEAGGFRWVDSSVPDPIAVFKEMAVPGNGGPIFENGRRAVWYAFNDPVASAWNKGFFRPDARLSIIFVSDEDDDSGDEPTIPEFVQWLSELKEDPEMVTVSALVSLDGRCSQGDEISEQYIDLAERTGGILFDVCLPNWEPVLTDLANLGAGLSREFYLPRVPDPDTLEVWVIDDGRRFDFVQGVDYTYDPVKNAIVFAAYTPRARAEVFVKYDVLESTSGR